MVECFSRSHTLELLVQDFHLRVGVTDSLIELNMQTGVLVRHVLVQVLLVVYVLSRLVSPEAQGAAGTLHDNVGAQPAEDAGLVVLGRVEIGNDGIIRVAELGLACRAACLSVGGLLVVGDSERVCTLDAEDVAARGHESAFCQLASALEVVAGQGVLHARGGPG